jgi:outer membrane immunogenic protein
MAMSSNVLFTAAGDTYIGSKSNMQLGWTVGGGGEYAIGKNWTIKAEYLYVDLGSQSYTYGNQCVTGGCTYTTDLKSREHVFRLGLNYKF